MTYVEYKSSLRQYLENATCGATWQELRDTLKLPYERPCPEWTRRLEKDIGLIRRKGSGRRLVWTLPSTTSPESHV